MSQEDDDRREVEALDALLGASLPAEMYDAAIMHKGARLRDMFRRQDDDDEPLDPEVVKLQLAAIAWQVELIRRNLPEQTAPADDRVARLEQRLDAMQAQLDRMAAAIEANKPRRPMMFGTVAS